MTKRWMHKGAAVVAAVTAIVGAGAAPATAAPPTRVVVDTSFLDESLSETCGFPVSVTLKGTLLIREFARDAGLTAVETINVAVTFASSQEHVTLRDVGANVFRVAGDGTTTLTLAGHAPFFFRGVVKLVETDGEFLLVSQSNGMVMSPEQLCAALQG